MRFLSFVGVAVAGLAFLALLPFVYLYLRLRRPPGLPQSAVRAGQPLDILYVRTDFWAGRTVGGAFSHLAGLCSGLRQLGHSVHILTNEPLPHLDSTDVRVTLVPTPPCPRGLPLSFYLVAYNLLFLSRTSRLARQSKPAVIYQRMSVLNISGLLLACRLKVPFLLEYNSPSSWKRESGDISNLLLCSLRSIFERFNLLGASGIYVVSDVLRDRLATDPILAPKVHVNPNGAEPDVFRPDLSGEQVRARLGLSDRFVAGFTGVYGPWHGVEFLARALPHVVAAVPNITLLFIGDERLREVVSSIVTESGNADRVVFLNRVPHKEVPEHLAACDVLVSPHVNMADGSKFFGSPVKIFEYMSMGKPIVASRIGQLEQILEHERTALLTTPGDSSGIASAIARLHAEPDLRARIAGAARDYFLGNFTWKHNAMRVLRPPSPRDP